jgi:hypothetical protein
MGDSTPLGALPAAQGALQEYRQYKKTEKPPKSEERAQLEAHYATLQTKVGRDPVLESRHIAKGEGQHVLSQPTWAVQAQV